jgi:transposase
MYDGYINAAREVLPRARVMIDRFHVAKRPTGLVPTRYESRSSSG